MNDDRRASTLDPLDLLEDLVRIDSANTVMGGPGEVEVARHLSGVLASIGCEVSLHDVPAGVSGAVAAGPNLVATLHGRADGPVLLLEAHLDTVAQARERQAVRRDGSRLYGRGACDTKGSAASMVAAIARLASAADHPTVVFAGAADEEVAMRGSLALVDHLPRVDGAIIGEPTSLLPVRVHNGLMRFRIVTHGTAAHTSRAHLGVNAVAAAARVVLAIQDELLPTLQAREHPLAGPALVTASVIRGGVAPNLVPERCEIELDRRIAPGEEPAAALAEIDALLDRLREAGDRITREEPAIRMAAVETPAEHPLIRLSEAVAGEELGRAVSAGGVPYGTDGSNLWQAGGIPCVVLGPGSIDQAHTDEEWVDLEEVARAAHIYEQLVWRYSLASEPAAGGSGKARA